jgi:hypothetical protein
MSDARIQDKNTNRRTASNGPQEAPSAGTASDSGATKHEPTGANSKEVGGRRGLDPVRYGDWEKNGRCIDF